MGGMTNVSGGYGGGTSTGGKGMQTPNNGYSSQYGCNRARRSVHGCHSSEPPVRRWQ